MSYSFQSIPECPVTGELDLAQMIAKLEPILQPEIYVFCTQPSPLDFEQLSRLSPFATVQEPEGLSLVLTRSTAETFGLSFQGTFRCLRLDVHSSLEAVGLTAAVSTALAKNGISANMIAGAFHDHILVPEADASRALAVLEALSASEHPR